MGNRLGNQRQKDAKAKEEKERNTKKEQEKRKKRQKKAKEKCKPGQHASEWDIDVEESSHFTGGDSESCVFHSAENVSVSPYLDSCTRSDFEQGAVSSGLLEVCPSVSHHPQVLSSNDFRDGFSLEACIPQDIARQDGYAETSSSATARHERHKSGSVKSKRSNSSGKSSSAYRSRYFTPATPKSQHGDDASSVGTSSQISGNEEGYSTPLLSTPVYQREERCHSSSLASKTLPRGKEIDVDDSNDIVPSASSFQHRDIYNTNHSHCKQQRQDNADFRNLPKPASPHPQRRKLSPKMASPFKLASSDDSSSSPTTPVPQRRATAFLDIFRSGSRGEASKKIKSTEIVTDTTSKKVKDKVKFMPLWKTWERSSGKKADKLSSVSIFGTTRKHVQRFDMGAGDGMKDKGLEEKKTVKKVSEMREESLKLSVDGCKKQGKEYQSSPVSSSSKVIMFKDSKTTKTGSENLNTHFSSSPRAAGGVEGEDSNRNSSPPTVRSAAFCIMKLEELEKAIEKTIREKFPDADPLLLKNRSNENELRGSRSLPTTPSLQKKLYVARKMDGTKRTNQEHSNSNKGTTRYCDETYESSPSPVMSPVVLRRFGARTRHASISPKIQRAKTAALYSSPMEMSRVEESFATKTVTRVPIYHAVSTQQPQTPVLASKFVKSLSAAQKSESKYDNVVDENYQEQSQTSAVAHLIRQEGVDEDDSDEIEEATSFNMKEDICRQKPVIVPTFSAVFGSVSPKLKRQVETKFKTINGHKGTTSLGDETVQGESERHTTFKSGCSWTAGDILGREISPVTQNATSKTSLTEDLYVSPVGNAFNQKKPALGGQLTHDDDERRPSKSVIKQFVTSSAEKNCSQTVTETQPNTDSRPISVKGHSKTINKFQSEDSAPSTVYAHIISDEGMSSLPHSAGKPHIGEAGAVPSFPDQRSMEPGTISHLSAQQDIGKENGRNASDRVTSPASARKHSSDHVVFGSAIALPCRLYASLPGPETINRGNISHIAHAPNTLVDHSENAWNAEKEKSIQSSEDEPLVQIPTSEQLTTTSNSVITHSALVSVSTELQEARKLFDGTGSAAICNAKKIPETPSDDGQLNVGVFSHQSSANAVPIGDQCDALPSVIHRKYRDPINQEQQPYSLIDNTFTHLQDEQNYVLYRQPVSQVISEMINVSKEQRQQPQHQLQHQRPQQRHHQSNPASPDHGIKLVKPTVAMVTTPPYEQPFLTLEEKTVQSGNSVNSPSPVNVSRIDRNSYKKEIIIQGSRSQEIQTDSYTTADKGVDSGGLIQSACPSIPSGPFTRAMDTDNTENNTRVEITDDSDESDFFKIVLACKKNNSQREKEPEGEGASLCKAVSKKVPPPSPTAMQELINEFDEEGEDDEAHENRETESELKCELEMKQFTDTIYKRLSDLLGSNQPGAENDLDDDVFEEDVEVTGASRSVHELLSRLERNGESFSSNDETVSHFTTSSSAVPSGKRLVQAKVLTIETSSSLSTTTSSDSDVYETNQTFQVLQTSAPRMFGECEDAEGVSIRRKEPNVFVFPEIHSKMSLNSDDARQRRSSREYHSDDDVATGRGIPDYYDDRPLWSRRQKPPGQLSANMMVMRRRERRERWLRKRRRNRTDLISTGSSDNGSDLYSHRGDAPMRENNNGHEEAPAMDFDKPGEPNVKGSVPKYSKPILPFFDNSQTQCRDNTAKHYVDRHQVSCHYREVDSGSNSDDDKYQHSEHAKDKRNRICFGDDEDNVIDGEDDENGGGRLNSNIAIPGIEETFNELMSVQNILEEMQDKTPTNEATHLMPLTTENVRSIRDFYKDGNGRRSRMSAADRTESDLDIYSETRDDASSESNVYADDEEDDDKFEPYATADDDLGATGGSSSAPCGSKSGDVRRGDHDDDSDTSFVVGCTFYNSNAYPSDAAADLASNTISNARKSPKSTSASHTPQVVANSDEEFWAGGVAIEESYKQLESVADAVSSTFQNAREQMHDIQHHLQALRRQMEVLQDDLICTSITITPDMSMGSTEK